MLSGNSLNALVPEAGLEPARGYPQLILRADPDRIAAYAIGDETAPSAEKSQSDETTGDHD